MSKCQTCYFSGSGGALDGFHNECNRFGMENYREPDNCCGYCPSNLKRGDHAWFVCNDGNGRAHIEECSVVSIYYNAIDTFVVVFPDYDDSMEFGMDAIGKEIFFDKQSAEKAVNHI